MRIVVTDYTFPDLAQERAAAAGHEFAAHQCKTAEEVADAVAGANVAVVQFAPFGSAAAQAVRPRGDGDPLWRRLQQHRHGGGEGGGLRVGYVPDYCTDEVAEHTAAAALSLLRKLPQMDASVRRGEWAAVRVAQPMKPFSQTVFGFFGLGQIGRAVLGRLKDFGFRFIASDPGLDAAQAAELGVQAVTAERLLAEADIISLHAPANAATTGFFDAARLAMMQPHAVLVNAARGQLIVEADLAAALKAGVIAGAALDVFHAEPLPGDSPLRDAPNLILTPHAAWYSEAAIHRLQGLVAEDIARALRGEGPRRPVPE